MNLKNHTLETLADPSAYADELLAKIARDTANKHYERLGRGNMGMGDFKRAVAAGQYPELVLAEIKLVIEKQVGIDNLMDDAAASLQTLELPSGWTATPGYPSIILTGPYNAEMPARLRRLGGDWDASAKQWLIPTEKHKSIARVFGNAEKAAAQKAAAKAAEKEAADKARAAEREAKAAARAAQKAAEREATAKAKAGRVRVTVGQYQVGDIINGKPITSFGQAWTEAGRWVQVTDEDSSAYGMMPGLDHYPRIRVGGGEFQYAYFD